MVGATKENTYPCIVDLAHKSGRDRDLGIIDYDNPDIGKGYFIEDYILMAFLDDEAPVLDAKVLRSTNRNRQKHRWLRFLVSYEIWTGSLCM